MSDDKVNGAKAFDFDACFSSLEVEQDGIDVPILRDDNRAESGFVIRLAGPNSTRNRGSLNRAIESRAMLMPGVTLTNDHIINENIESLVACTISWKFPDGFDGPPCTPDNARKLYIERGGIREQAWAAKQNVSRFMKR